MKVCSQVPTSKIKIQDSSITPSNPPSPLFCFLKGDVLADKHAEDVGRVTVGKGQSEVSWDHTAFSCPRDHTVNGDASPLLSGHFLILRPPHPTHTHFWFSGSKWLMKNQAFLQFYYHS